MTNDFDDHGETDSPPDVCRSCGKLAMEHRSLSRTCKELQDAEAKIAEYRQSLAQLAGYAASVEGVFSQKWIDGLVGYLNKAAATIGMPKRFVSRRSTPGDVMWVEIQSKEPS